MHHHRYRLLEVVGLDTLTDQILKLNSVFHFRKWTSVMPLTGFVLYSSLVASHLPSLKKDEHTLHSLRILKHVATLGISVYPGPPKKMMRCRNL